MFNNETSLLELEWFGLAQFVSFFDSWILVLRFEYFLLQNLKRLFQLTSKLRFPFST